MQPPLRRSSPRPYTITAKRLIVTDKSPTLPAVIAHPVPDAEHCTNHYVNNRIECDYGRFKARLKARLRPMRGLKTKRTASVVIRGHALLRNIRRGDYHLDHDTTPTDRLGAAFGALRSTLE